MKDRLEQLLHLGAETLANSTGAAFGLVFAGSAGAIAGAALTPIIEAAFKKVGSDLATRQLSEKETLRVAVALYQAKNVALGRLMAGEKPRDDIFFTPGLNDRSPAETALEGVLMICRDQWEEKKVPWIANIYVNAAFSSEKPEIVNRVIRLSDRMSWQQICAVATIGNSGPLGIDMSWLVRPSGDMTAYQNSIFGEILELYEGQFRFLSAGNHGFTGLGKSCFELMALKSFPVEEMKDFAEKFPRGEYRSAGATMRRDLVITEIAEGP